VPPRIGDDDADKDPSHKPRHALRIRVLEEFGASGAKLWDVEFDVAAILFDSDGVLVDSHAAVERSWRQLSREFGLDLDGIRRELIGVRAEDTLGRHLAGEEFDRAIARLEDLEVASSVGATEVLGAGALTRSLPVNRWAIVTSASRRLGIARWEGAGILRPPVTVAADDVMEGKPHPEPFLTAARMLGVPPQRCLIFEDSPSGGRAASAAGAAVVAVGHSEWDQEPHARIMDLSGVSVRDGEDSLLVSIEA